MAVIPSPADLLPHAAPMVLLDRVVSWDETAILCTTESHRRPDHPLSSDGGDVSIFCGLEYAAQAMAAHNRLIAEESGSPQQGFLATASRVRAQVARLDDIEATLSVRAVRCVSSGDSSLYDFSLTDGERLLLEGQLMVVKQGATNAS